MLAGHSSLTHTCTYTTRARALVENYLFAELDPKRNLEICGVILALR